MRIAEAISLISDLEDHFERMGQWERTFVEQISTRFERFPTNAHLSDREAQKLKEISEKYLK